MSEEVVLVTGGSRGIGKSIVEKYAKAGGYAVYGTATSISGKKKIDQVLEKHSGIGAGLVFNMLDEVIDDFVTNFLSEYGAPSILINNAGVTDDALFLRMRESQWDNVIDTNLKGAFRITKAFIRHMIKARKGKIIFLSSVVAASGNAGQVNYCASKAGIEAMCKSIAREVAYRGITVNCVAPGFISTEMTDNLPSKLKEKLAESIPMNRFGSPQDVAEAVFFLSSEKAAYITGTVLNVNGGMLMS